MVKKWVFLGILLISGLAACQPQAKPTPPLGKPVYQPFEHGFMLLRAEGDCVYVFGPTANDPDGNIFIAPDAQKPFAYCTAVGTAVAPLPLTPAPGLYLPTGAIGNVWNRYDLQKSLGYATQPEQAYTEPVYLGPTPVPSGNGIPWMMPLAILPDGRGLWCGVRAATNGSCEVDAAE
ncbi:MAG TPA: hypothetical protein VHO69_02280 [Phototrophicaceae bacterium]|nr:hypothetical protein [Phototrophicaceae bacterium]